MYHEIRTIMEIGKIISNITKRLKLMEVISQRVGFDCLKHSGKLTTIIQIKEGQIKRKICREILINGKSIKNIEIVGFPMLVSCPEAINYISKENVYRIDLEKLPTHIEQFVIEVEFNLRPQLIDKIVDRHYKIEPLEEEDTYWLHAQLICPKALRDLGYEQVELKDVDVEVEVGIVSDVKPSIPPEVIETLRVIRDWIYTGNRDQKTRLSMRHLRLMRVHGKRIDFENIERLGNYCSPENFSKYVETKKPIGLTSASQEKIISKNCHFPLFQRLSK